LVQARGLTARPSTLRGVSADEILALAERFLKEEVAPHAAAIDADPDALRLAMEGLCARQLMALRRPTEFGGPALDEDAFRRFQETVARYSGSLAFLQTQHQSAGSMIAKGDNPELRAEYLPQMGDGRKLVGIGFSQLRRPGPPMMRAEACDGGYRLNGDVPWITGFGLYPEFLVGATLPDGRAVFAVVPFVDSQRPGEAIAFSEPMRLAAMESAQTVSGTFENWFVPDARVVFLKPAGWIQNNDMINVTLQGHFALGCARAGLDIVAAAAERKGLPFLHDAWTKLDAELGACRKATVDARQVGEETTEERLKVRAWAIDLAVRCAHAGVAASSGAANSAAHPAQRVYREALVFTVSAQTSAIMEATLERLARE
jgi:alkylation response protein AidB-like acyl-CoA dehydrogenase